jgi:hypothetical protein
MARAGAAGQLTRRPWRALALISCALLLALVARFYHPGFGFSALIVFSEAHEPRRLPALRAIPHYRYPGDMEYDGAQYVQLALDPLLRDPAIDGALDATGYRARRILFAWTAYALGLGRPAWIVQAYALQDVLAWLVLAWVLTRWIPLTTARFFALWFASMFSHGLLASVRLAVLDGPSLLLLALAVAAAEKGRAWVSGLLVGIAGLGRETNLLGAVAQPPPRGWRGWLRLLGALMVIGLPLLLWQDYVWSIYRGTSATEGSGMIAVPFASYLGEWRDSLEYLDRDGLWLAGRQLLVLIAFSVQVVYLARARKVNAPWWRLAVAYATLAFIVDASVWGGYPGAITRVVLPLKFGFNILLAQDEAPGSWRWAVLGNLDLAMSLDALAT